MFTTGFRKPPGWWSGPSGGAEATGSASGLGDGLHLLHLQDLEAGEDQLGDPVAARDPDGGPPEVDEGHFHLAPIVRVDGARSVRNRDAVPDREARPGPHLTLHGRGKLHPEPGPHQPDFLSRTGSAE